MKTCLIFCAAEFDTPVEKIRREDYIIAADGGLRHTQKWNLRPDVILGDFDSLGYVPRGANVFPVEKDDTDAMLAVRRGLEAGCDRFLLYGSVDGPRLDHTVANFQTLQFLADHGARGYLIGRDTVITVLKNSTLTFPAGNSGTVSVFCMGPDAHGVCLRGLHYPMENGTLTAGFPLGVSNHFTGEPGEISVADGSLLLFWERRNGVPPRQ